MIFYVCSQIHITLSLFGLKPRNILAVFSEILCCKVGPHLLSCCLLGRLGSTEFVL